MILLYFKFSENFSVNYLYENYQFSILMKNVVYNNRLNIFKDLNPNEDLLIDNSNIIQITNRIGGL